MSGTYLAILPTAFETLKKVKSKSASMASQLAAGCAAERALGKTLGACRKSTPCNSGACPKFNRHFRLWRLKHGLQVIEAGGPQAASTNTANCRYWTAASVIPRGMAAPAGQLNPSTWPQRSRASPRP